MYFVYFYIFYIFSIIKGVHMKQIFMDELNGNEIPLDKTIPIDINDLTFTLFSKEGSQHDTTFYLQNTTEFLQKIFNRDLPTKFIVHGWMGSLESIPVRTTGTAYLKENDYNIVGVDWSNLASWEFYPISAFSVDEVGTGVAKMIDKLIESEAITLDKLHLIGHSLGAHVMGIAGSTMKAGLPPRITGLDPANPGFEYIARKSSRLDSSDAEFVDIIHSSAGVAGFYYQLGHADFYPNGGVPPQPGCVEIRNPRKLFGCSHGRSYEFFIESIKNPKGFRSVECDSWSSFSEGLCDNNTVAYMGAFLSTETKGTFYLETNSEPPFAKG